MEENEEDKVVSMIINYFTARVNISVRGGFFRISDEGVCRVIVEKLLKFIGDKVVIQDLRC